MASSFQFGHVSESETQFNSVQPLSFTFSSINSGNSRAGLAKARKAARPSSPALNSIDPVTFKSTSESPFAFGLVSSFSAANPFTFNRHEVDKVSDHDAEKPIEAASKLQHEKTEPRIGEKENNSTKEMGVLAPSDIKQDKVARQANQDSMPNRANTALVVISRILKGIPQSPHFYQLINLSGHTRKVLISSWDRIFEETVEQMHSLQVNDFWVRARELWKTMGELQSMGYNVIPLRRRLVELTDVMIELKLTKVGMKGLLIKAENHRMEKSRLEFVILRLQEMIMQEHYGTLGALAQMVEMEKEVPKFDGVFAKLAMEPL